AAIHRMQPEIQTIVILLVQRPASIRTEATSVFRGVIGKNRAGSSRASAWCRRGDILAWENAIAETGVNAIHFVMPESRFKCNLGDNVGCWVEGVVSRRVASCDRSAAAVQARRAGRNGAVIKPTTVPGRTNQEVRCIGVGGDGLLRVFN